MKRKTNFPSKEACQSVLEMMASFADGAISMEI